MEKIQSAIFGGGCFWCTEAIFQRLRGVLSVTSGYSGGSVANPTYEQVSAGNTGHIESIKIEFDPEQISYEDLVNVFMATHDPTTKDRQGNDVGPQYRSTIFFMDAEQKKIAGDYIEQLEKYGTFGRPIVTEVKAFDKFYPAESYHKNYYNQNRGLPYCQFVIDPKITKLRVKFAPLLLPE